MPLNHVYLIVIMAEHGAPPQPEYSMRHKSTEMLCYDAEKDHWTKCSPLIDLRFESSLIVMHGKIYILGGYGRDRDWLERYCFIKKSRNSYQTFASSHDCFLFYFVFGTTITLIKG